MVGQEYAPLDPYLDGILRFGGGYSNMLGSNASNTDQRNQVFDQMRKYAAAVANINAKSAGPDTCVFVPPPQQGLGCKYGRPNHVSRHEMCRCGVSKKIIEYYTQMSCRRIMML